MHCSSLLRTLTDVECDCNGHRVLLSLGEFFLMFSMVYFGLYCCQEELQWGWKFSKADVGHLPPAFFLFAAVPAIRHGFWGLHFCRLVIENNISSYLVNVNFQMKIMAEARSDELFFPLCMWQVSPRLAGHTSQRELPSHSQSHLLVQVLLVLSQAQMLSICLLRQEDLPVPHMHVLTWTQRKHYLILTCIRFNSCTASAKQESDQNVAHCF